MDALETLALLDLREPDAVLCDGEQVIGNDKTLEVDTGRMEKPHNVVGDSVQPATPGFAGADRIVRSESKRRREVFESNFYTRMRLVSSCWQRIYSTCNHEFTVSESELAQTTSVRRVVERRHFDDGFVSPCRGSCQRLVCPEDGGRKRHQEAKTVNVSIC